MATPSRKDDDASEPSSGGKGEEWKALIKSSGSRLTRTRMFQKAIDSAFNKIDVDKSGDVTLEELYAGLLLIHLSMASYIGASACRPATKEYVTEIFMLLDADHSGKLTKEEFGAVAKILYSQVLTRIAIQWTLTLMIVPFISQYTVLLCGIVHEFWKDIDDDLDPLQRMLWRLWAAFLSLTPGWIDGMGKLVSMAFGKIPEGVWKGMPTTILTLAQTSVVVPYALNRVEDFFLGKARVIEGRGKIKQQ